MIHLIRTEFKRSFKSWVLWTVIVSLLALLMLLLFPAFEDLYVELEALLASYPDSFLEAFGLGENGLTMDDIYGWYGVEGYLFVLLIGSAYAGLLGSSILSTEEDDHTIEFLLSRPITRSQVYVAKYMVILVNLALLNGVVSVILLGAFIAFAEINWVVWLLFSAAPFIIQLIFATLGMLAGVFVTKSRQVTSIALGLVIGLYVLDIISALTESADILKYFTPYEYINAVSIVNDEALDPLYMAISVLLILGSFSTGWFFYVKKDMTA